MKYFVVSDIHGEYAVLESELNKLSFNDSQDTLITLGDNFDRGNENLEVYRFLVSLPHKILIRGNHELILANILKRKALVEHDSYNGALATIANLAGVDVQKAYEHPKFAIERIESRFNISNFIQEKMVWYAEIGDFIFTHGWLPNTNGKYSKRLDSVSTARWVDCAWANLQSSIDRHILLYPEGYEKTIVFGHWHTVLLNERYLHKQNAYGAFVDEKHNLIGLDSCVNYTKRLNVMIIEV